MSSSSFFATDPAKLTAIDKIEKKITAREKALAEKKAKAARQAEPNLFPTG